MTEMIDEAQLGSAKEQPISCCSCCGHVVGVCQNTSHDDAPTFQVPRRKVNWHGPNGTKNEQNGEWGL